MSLLSITVWCALSSLSNRSYFTRINSLGAVDWRGLLNLNPGMTRSSGCPQAETGHLFFLFYLGSTPIRAATFFLNQDWARQPGLGFLLLFCTGVKRHSVCFCFFPGCLAQDTLRRLNFFSLLPASPPSELLHLSKSGLSTPACT